MNAKHLKHRLMLKLSRESRPTLPEVRESPPDEDVFTARRQSLPLLPALRRSSIVYEENIPVVVRRRGVTMTVRIFGAEETETPTSPYSPPPDQLTAGPPSSPRATESMATAASGSFQLLPFIRKPLTSLSVDSIVEPFGGSASRRRSLSAFSVAAARGGLKGAESPVQDGNLLAATPTSSLSPCSPRSPEAYRQLRTESPTQGIGLFKQVFRFLFLERYSTLKILI